MRIEIAPCVTKEFRAVGFLCANSDFEGQSRDKISDESALDLTSQNWGSFYRCEHVSRGGNL